MLISLIFYRKKLSQPGLFPIKLQDDELQWKLCLDYDVLADKFLLYIDGRSFHQMPTQSEINPKGPQNILNGVI